MKIIRNISEIGLEKIKDFYCENFNDLKPFVNLIFASYLKQAKFFGIVNKNELIMISFFINKRIVINNFKHNAYLIFAVCVNSKYRNMHIMSKYLNAFINELKKDSKFFLIRTHNWDIYKHFAFKPINYSQSWILKPDQILNNKLIELENKINYDKINLIKNTFINKHKIKNFSYKTNKENKKYLKLCLATNYIIQQFNSAYLIKSNLDSNQEKIIDFGFINLTDFIKLLSVNSSKCIINSIIDLDKKYFKPITQKNIFTKIYDCDLLKNNNSFIYFVDEW